MSYRSAATFLQNRSVFFRDVMAIIVSTLREKTAAANERSKTRRALNSLDDYLLKDMGISRCDIDRIANRTYPPR